MNKKDIKKIQWDEKAVKNFEGFLKQMYGEYGNLKMPNFQYGKIKVD